MTAEDEAELAASRVTLATIRDWAEAVPGELPTADNLSAAHARGYGHAAQDVRAILALHGRPLDEPVAFHCDGGPDGSRHAAVIRWAAGQMLVRVVYVNRSSGDLMPEIHPDGTWTLTAPEGALTVGGLSVRPGDTVGGRIEVSEQ